MGQLKLGRNYSLSIQFPNGTKILIQPPFTIEFDITKTTLTSANICQIRIYNLSPENRNLLRYDFSNTGTILMNILILLKAGYGNNIPLIFSGNITQAWSVREGNNFITTIECFDGGDAFVNAIIPAIPPFPAGTSKQTIYKTLMSYLPDVAFGAIGSSFIYDKSGSLLVTSRSYSPTGNVVDVLAELTGKAFFIENGKSYILGNNECVEGQVAFIDTSTGLLNTPLRENSIVTIEMMFEPGITIGQLILLNTLTFSSLNSNQNTNASNVNGYYKITSIKHRGMISESVCGDAITTLEFFSGTSPLTTVKSS